jgi:CDP-4-dehydro-6-deoxyglucose reductase
MGTPGDVWHGIPRGEILWHPTVAEERCIGCGLCATSCGRGVYAFDYARNKPVVVEPAKCMVGCTTCATICLQDAIEFPPQGYVRGLIRSRKILRQSKDMLREQVQKYGLSREEGTG